MINNEDTVDSLIEDAIEHTKQGDSLQAIVCLKLALKKLISGNEFTREQKAERSLAIRQLILDLANGQTNVKVQAP